MDKKILSSAIALIIICGSFIFINNIQFPKNLHSKNLLKNKNIKPVQTLKIKNRP